MSLVEILVGVAIFTIAIVIASALLIEMVKLEKRTSIESVIYDDVRLILQQLTTEIQGGAIDYDEYFSVCVIQNACGEEEEAYYGIHHGIYGSRFYDPGGSLDSAATVNPFDLGLECLFPSPLADGQECEIVYSLSSDFATGQNPYVGDSTTSSAFCDESSGVGVCPNSTGVIVDELYLIDASGTRKTILGRQKIHDNDIGGDWAIGKVVMEGIDADQNGFVDIFTCEDEYECFGCDGPNNCVGGDIGDNTTLFEAIFKDGNQFTASNHPFFSKEQFMDQVGASVPRKSDLANPFGVSLQAASFVPITPWRTNVKDLQFIITPVDDPYRGFAESNGMNHPTVTIILTLGLSEEAQKIYPGEFEDVIVQLTVASGQTEAIQSYPPIRDIRSAPNDDSWIDAVLSDALNVTP